MTCDIAQKNSAKSAIVWITMFLLATGGTAGALTASERQTVTSMKSVITSLRGKLAEAETANQNYLQAVRKAAQQTTVLQESARVAAVEAARLAAERDELAAQVAAANVRLETLDRKYQTAQMIIAGAVATLALVLALQLGAGLPPQYRIAVAIGAAIAAASTVYVVL